MTTLVIGARGGVGRHVLDQLVAAGEPVRASVRDLVTAGDLPDGIEVVAADLTKPDTLKPAFDGVRQVFVYALAEGAEAFADAARGAGIEQVVLMSSGSVLLPWTGDNAIAKEHREIEHVMTDSGLRCTPIRPLVLASNALNWAHSIRRDGTVALAYPHAKTPPLHERDIAAIAVAALTGSAAGDVSGLLTGPELLSQRRQVELISEAIGRPLTVEELSEAQARDRFSRFMPPEIAQAIIEYLVHGTEPGGSPATDVAQRVLGRPPLSFRQWAADHTTNFN